MNTVNVSLSTPVEHGGKTYSDLTFREPKVGDLMAADTFAAGMGQMVALLALVSDVPLPAFKEISSSDFKNIMAKAGPLMGNDQKTKTGD